MSFLYNLFSSPAKYTPAKKRNIPETPTPRSSEKRKRDAYDPEEYQNAVYAGAGAVAVNGDDGYEMDGNGLDEEEAAACQLQDEVELEAELEVKDGDEDDGDDDARPYATPKSVRKLSRDLYTIIEARSPSRTKTHDKAGKTLAGKSTKVTISPSPSTRTGSETENEEDEAIDEIDWSSSDDEVQLSFSPTTSSARPDMTSTGEIEVEVDRLKHMPVGKQPRPRTGAVRSNTTTTKSRLTKPSPSSAKLIIPPSTQPQSPSPFHHTMTSPLPTPTHPPNFEYPPDWHENTPAQKWDTQPNLRARELSSNPASIRAELPSEPDYAFRDAEIRDGLSSLMSSVEDFSKAYFPSGAHASHTTTCTTTNENENGDGDENENEIGDENGDGDIFIKKAWFKTLTSETTKLINCVASGGPSGVWGWHDLFVNKDKLQALVCAMIGNVLSEQVLQHAFFGGTEEGVTAVAAVQREMKESDGEFIFGFCGGRAGVGMGMGMRRD